jgi:hypothetical protein
MADIGLAAEAATGSSAFTPALSLISKELGRLFAHFAR